MVIDTVKIKLKNGLIKWQWQFGNGRAVGYLDKKQEFTRKTEHAHLPSPSKIQAKNFANEVREKATNTGNAPRPPQADHAFQWWAKNAKGKVLRLMSVDSIRKPKPKYSIANEKTRSKRKKLQSTPYTEVFKTLYR